MEDHKLRTRSRSGHLDNGYQETPISNGTVYTGDEGNGHVKGDYGSILDSSKSYQPDVDVIESQCCRRWCGCLPDWVVKEFGELFNLAWSMIILSLFGFLIGPVSLAFCGHLGTTTMDGVALASTVINVTGVSVGVGLATACDTFFAQSFGSVNKKMVGIYLIRGLIIINLFIFPCWALHLNSELILVAMGQDREVSRIAGEYIIWWMPALPAVFTYEVMTQYLRCQNIVIPTIIVGAIGVAVCALSHYILLYVFDFGHIGSAVSQVLSFYIMGISLVVYTIVTKNSRDTWGGWTVEIFQDWTIFLKLAMSGFLMVGLEWWSFEIGTFLAGLLGPVPLGAQAVGFQVQSIAYMLPLGVGLACNIRVGQMLGAEQSLRAWQVSKLGLLMIVCSGLLMTAFIAATSNLLPRIFSSDPDVIEYSTNVVLMVAVFEFFDGVAGVCAGILRGCGRQVIGAVIIFFGYYFIGIPIGVVLMFLTKLEVVGLYVGLTIGLILEALVFSFIVYRTDWAKEIQSAQVRAGTADMTDEEKERLREENQPDGNYHDVHLSSEDEETIPFITGPKQRKRTKSRSDLASSKFYTPYSSSSQVDLLEKSLYNSSPTGGRQLCLNIFMFIFFMVLIFVLGLCVRFFIPIPPLPWTELNNATMIYENTTFPTSATTLS